MYRTRSRKVGSRAPRNIVLVIVEGETERCYFNALKERDSNIRIILIKPGPADPVHLLGSCIENMKDMDIDIEDGDLAICVFDVDETPYERIIKAGESAIKNGIILSITNPCFELWLAPHYQDVLYPLDRKEA